jgi:carbamoyltransferase
MEPNVFGLDLSNSRHYQNLALKVQLETEAVLLKLLGMLKEKYPTDNLYLSGGVALNVVANERIKNSNLFKNVILNGSVEDNGTAIGAGLAASIKLGCQRKSSLITDYYGVHYNYKEIMEAVTQFDFKHKVLSEKEILKFAAEMIAQENIIGWFQGASEFGPRALGNRSILANPASPRTKYMLDHFMKCRDRYRPYSPVVIEECASQYFDIDSSSPVMMRNVKVLDKRLVAITHFDGTGRVQTVNETQNKVLYSLLLEVEKSTGFPVLLNTSFNRPGEPIVESPFDALASFSMGSLDYLFLENVLISR